MRKTFILFILMTLTLSACSLISKKKLPKPEVPEGLRGELGIDKNINEETIDNYLNRDDSVYFDMRMIDDPASYENIGGTSVLDGYIKGFKIIPYPYICNPINLPEEAGEAYKGSSLWTRKGNKFEENFKESKEIVESLFPKDKNIFLMCGGGGYAGQMKELLVHIGYDESKIYNVGGYWNYRGKNKVEIPKKNNIYDYSGAPLYMVDFKNLTPVSNLDFNQHNQKDDLDIKNNSSSISDKMFIKINDEKLKQLEEECDHFALYIYSDGCATCLSFKKILKNYLKKNNKTIYVIESLDFNNCDSKANKCVKFAPAIVIYHNGQISSYLDSSSDKDLIYFENEIEFTKWMNDKTKIN